MKYLKSLTLMVAVLIAASSSAAGKGSNYPLYSLQGVVSYEVSLDSKTLFTIEKTDSGNMFVSREISSGEEILKTHLDIPEPVFMNTVIVGSDVYLFHLNILDREKGLYETSIFKVDGNSGEVNSVYNSQEMLGFAERFHATENGLLLTEKRGNRPFLFDLETNEMKAVELGEDYRVRAFDPERNCAIIIKQSNFSTQFNSNDGESTYTEGDGSLLDVYVCDFSNNFKLAKVGQYQPSYFLSENKDESRLPHFIIEDGSYAWVVSSFIVNSFPATPFVLVGDPALYSAWESLVGYTSITEVSFVGSQYILANQFSDVGETSLAVFNIQNPVLEKAETVAKSDRERIKSLLRKDTTTEKNILDPVILSQVFDARFYEINLVTTFVDTIDGDYSSSSSTESFVAVGRDAVYSVLKKNEELVPHVAADFLLDEKSAALFQDALDVLFPEGHFAEKHKTFYKKDDQWIFVRDESFGAKVGIKVTVNGDGKIISIESEDKISMD